MALELKATVIQINPEINGQGRNGTWRKQEVIVETKSQYPKKVCLSIWGDKIDQFGLSTGNEYTFNLDIESREYNGRWYTDAKAYDAKPADGQQGGGFAPKVDDEWNAKAAQIKGTSVPDFDAADDDLPF
jgi:hypothetical protein